MKLKILESGIVKRLKYMKLKILESSVKRLNETNLTKNDTKRKYINFFIVPFA